MNRDTPQRYFFVTAFRGGATAPAGALTIASRDSVARLPISVRKNTNQTTPRIRTASPVDDRQQRQHGRTGFGLTRLGRGFDDLAMSLRCHDDLIPSKCLRCQRCFDTAQ